MARQHALRTIAVPHLPTTCPPRLDRVSYYLFPPSHINARIEISNRLCIEAVIPTCLTPNEIIRQVIGRPTRSRMVCLVESREGGGPGVAMGQGGHARNRGQTIRTLLQGDVPIEAFVRHAGGPLKMEILSVEQATRGRGNGGEASDRNRNRDRDRNRNHGWEHLQRHRREENGGRFRGMGGHRMGNPFP